MAWTKYTGDLTPRQVERLLHQFGRVFSKVLDQWEQDPQHHAATLDEAFAEAVRRVLNSYPSPAGTVTSGDVAGELSAAPHGLDQVQGIGL
jgi:hypothetical protein